MTIHLDTSVLVDALTGPRRSLDRLVALVEQGHRIALSTLVLYEWLRRPRTTVELRVQELFDSSINPSIASHGGYVDLIGIEGKTAYVQLGGGCQGCGMADVTLKQGIDVAVKETAPEIEQVVDVTDHASGTNPYYQPSKK